MEDRCACGAALLPGLRVRGRCKRCYMREYMYALRQARRPVPRSRQEWPCAACGQPTRPSSGRALGMCKRCHDRAYARRLRAG